MVLPPQPRRSVRSCSGRRAGICVKTGAGILERLQGIACIGSRKLEPCCFCLAHESWPSIHGLKAQCREVLGRKLSIFSLFVKMQFLKSSKLRSIVGCCGRLNVITDLAKVENRPGASFVIAQFDSETCY